MSLYRRGKIWWFKFEFAGSPIRESTGLTNKEAARHAETNRKAQLRSARAGIAKRVKVPLFSSAADEWMKAKKTEWSPKTFIIESTNLNHLKPVFGKRLVTDIDAADVADYRSKRGAEGASPKTVSLEMGSLRGIMLFHDFDATWAAIKKKITFAKAAKKGRVISLSEQDALLKECQKSRSRSLYPAIVIAIHACLRHSEIRLLQWRNIDLVRRTITVGESKTDAGEGRVIPMTTFLHSTLVAWSENFPERKLNHHVFPFERYGGAGTKDVFGFAAGKPYETDPTRPVGDWKEAWEGAKQRAGVGCRFHDLRHTGCTRLLDAGVSHPVVAEIMGWSTSTAIRMIKEVYGHISLPTRQRAIEQVEAFMHAQNLAGQAQNPAQSKELRNVTIQ